jgi:hypothetical protein
MAVLAVDPDAPAPPADTAALLTATALIDGREVVKELGTLGPLALSSEPAKLRVEIRADRDSGTPVVNDDGQLELTIRSGETITAMVVAERLDHAGLIEFGKEDSGRNLAHGLIIDNIGLNGLMIPEGQTEQRFFITAADWVPASTRPLHLTTSAAGPHATRPILLHVVRP